MIPAPIARRSDAIAIARVICIVGVVYVHAWTGRGGADLDALRTTGQEMLRWVLMEIFGRSAVPLIQQLNAQTDAWRANEIARARKQLARGEDVEAVLEALSRGLTQKMLHGALAELHSAAPQHRPQVASTVARMFLRGDVPANLPASIAPSAPSESDPA